MTVRSLGLVLSVLLAAPLAAAPQTTSTTNPPRPRITASTRVIAGSLLVRPAVDESLKARAGETDAALRARKTKAAQHTVDALAKELGVPLTFKRHLVLDWLLLEVGVDVDEDATLALVARAQKVKGLRGAAAEWVMRRLATPGDPFFGLMWHLDAIGARGAWDITQGTTTRRVGVVDTGTFFGHEDLVGKRGAEFDFISDSFQANDGDGRDGDATDPGDNADCNGDGFFDAPASSFHGTHVAGTILAGGDNGVGITGVNWNAKLVTGRALGRCGGTTVDIDEAVAWMAGFQIDGVPNIPAAERVRVVNLSLGATGAPCDDFTDSVWDAVAGQNVVIVVAAGNDGNNVPVASPANCDDSLAVAAFGHDGNNTLSSFSNFGPEIDIVAPGGDQRRTGVFEDGVLSGIHPDASPFQDRAPYTFYEGTSMAAPHAAGVVSLMLDANPGLSAADITSLLKANSDTCGNCQGKPSLRADLAVAAAAGAELPECSSDIDCAGVLVCIDNVCVEGGEGEGEGEEGEGEPAGECDERRGNMDCGNGERCVEDDGVGSCEDGAGPGAAFSLCEFNRDCDTGLCERGVCTVTCDDGCRDGYSCVDEDDSGVPGGLCVADSCLDNETICGDLNCSYSSASRYVCATDPSNYGGFCGQHPASWAPVAAAGALLLVLRRRRR
jgi:serine protease